MIIREAEEKDASILSNLLTQLGYPTSVDEAHKRILLHKKDGYQLMMSELDGQPIGFIALHWYHAFHHSRLIGRIVAFCVDEKHRSSGLGSQLLKYAEDLFKNKNCVKIELTSNLRRKESHEYYFRKGYQQTSMHFVKYLE
jgi:GNAT superfamily N-acetyltransferase